MILDGVSLWGLWVHPAMLGWLAAAAAPLLIHLLSRRKYREVPWAAMQYLLAAMKKNSRRIRIEHYLLLAIRTAILLAVVLALAEPMLEQSGLATRSGTPTHKLIVLDASYSMAYKTGDRTRFERAKQLAGQIVDQSNQGDGFTLLLMADPPQMIVGTPSFAPTDYLGEIAAAKITAGGADLPATLATVERVLQAAHREFPRLDQDQVYFLTDLGRTTWAQDLTAGALSDFRDRSRRLGETAALTVIDLGQPDADNVALDQLHVGDAVVTVGQETSLIGEIRNYGRSTLAQLPVELYVDGLRVGQRTVELPAGGRATATFLHRFDAAAEHALEMRLAYDALPVDDHRYLALPVKDQLRVLCVDGRPAGGNFKSATDFLRVALAPPADDHHRARVQPESVGENALLDNDLEQFDCIFLCDLAQFTERESKVLRSYLNFGGGVVFFLGEQVVADNYNRQLVAADVARRVLPARLLRPVEQSHYSLDPLGYRHPLIAAFRDQEQAGLLTTPVYKYFQLQLPEDSRAAVAVAVDNGDPFIVEEQIGRGRSIVVATSADISWTAMPMWPSYVPVVQELLMLAIRGQVQERNVLIGQPIGGLLPHGSAQKVEVRTSAGDEKQAAIEGSGADRTWVFADTGASGIVRATISAGGSQPSTDHVFAVNVNTVESDLAQIDVSELSRDVWPGVHYLHRADWQASGDDDSAKIVVRSRLHLWLLGAALVLLLVECCLTWFSGRYAT